MTHDGILTKEQLIMSGGLDKQLTEMVEVTTKGPEAFLPDGMSFLDKDGHPRTEVRVKWWQSSAKTWADIAMSVPEPSFLAVEELPESMKLSCYSNTAKMVFFGHYWLTGEPDLQAHNALCLDYSAGKGGPLVSYQFNQSDTTISLENLSVY